jgi:DNA-binding GntR family transcriptional regulator
MRTSIEDPDVRLADSLRDELEQDIVTEALRPGERLDEQTLATRFGVSRTPIREALVQLAVAGLVALQPRRGAFVASLSLKEIIERFEVMAALEGACGALAARRLTDEERARLVQAHEAWGHEAGSGDADDYYYGVCQVRLA